MFTEYFGHTPRAKLLDFLGDHPTSDYTITELSQKAGLARPTVYRVVEALTESGMIKETRKVGQSRMFQMNMEHPVALSVMQADMVAAKGEYRVRTSAL